MDLACLWKTDPRSIWIHIQRYVLDFQFPIRSWHIKLGQFCWKTLLYDGYSGLQGCIVLRVLANSLSRSTGIPLGSLECACVLYTRTRSGNLGVDSKLHTSKWQWEFGYLDPKNWRINRFINHGVRWLQDTASFLVRQTTVSPERRLHSTSWFSSFPSHSYGLFVWITERNMG
jgi:hypothetical protein